MPEPVGRLSVGSEIPVKIWSVRAFLPLSCIGIPLEVPMAGLGSQPPLTLHIPVFGKIEGTKVCFVPFAAGKALLLLCSDVSAPFVMALKLVNRPLDTCKNSKC